VCREDRGLTQLGLGLPGMGRALKHVSITTGRPLLVLLLLLLFGFLRGERLLVRWLVRSSGPLGIVVRLGFRMDDRVVAVGGGCLSWVVLWLLVLNDPSSDWYCVGVIALALGGVGNGPISGVPLLVLYDPSNDWYCVGVIALGDVDGINGPTSGIPLLVLLYDDPSSDWYCVGVIALGGVTDGGDATSPQNDAPLHE